jgi:hypothetical protein
MGGSLNFLIALLLLASAIDVHGKSYYNTAQNNFGGLFPHPGMRMSGRYKAIENDRLIEENATMATAITTDTMTVNSIAYRYQLRLANLNNKQGKSMSIKNPMTGAKTTITSPQWGIVFNYDENGNYYAVTLSCDNSTPFDDITDQRMMQITLVRCDENGTTELSHTSLSKGVSLEDDMNTLCVDVDEHGVRVSIGKEELQQVMEASISRPSGAVRVGYLVGPGARVAIDRSVLTLENEQQITTTAVWTIDALDEYLEASADPTEGYWKYLDRDMQDEWLRLGGRYTLAVVRAEDGYDLIYIDGAQVKKSMWQPGMLKGHMSKTIFSGNYDLSWIDATMEPIDNDAYATLENGVILTLYFPTYKSQVRFAKVLDIE